MGPGRFGRSPDVLDGPHTTACRCAVVSGPPVMIHRNAALRLHRGYRCCGPDSPVPSQARFPAYASPPRRPSAPCSESGRMHLYPRLSACSAALRLYPRSSAPSAVSCPWPCAAGSASPSATGEPSTHSAPTARSPMDSGTGNSSGGASSSSGGGQALSIT